MALLSPTRLAHGLVLIAAILALCDAHGMMCEPRQRGAYHSSKCGSDKPMPENPVVDYCAHCLNGGTVATVKGNLPAGGWKVYEPVKDFDGSGDRAGLCGDPKGRHDHMIGGDFMPYDTVPIVANWKTGSQVDFSAELDTNHNGYFDFFVCDVEECDAADIEGSCFKNGFCYKLNRVAHKDCEDPNVNTHYECGPIDDAYPGRWYVPCRNTGHVGVHIVGGESGTMRYQLPPGLTCEHCVVQWYWATANSCAPRGFLEYFENYNNPFGTSCESDGGGKGAHRPGMGECGGASVPEEFWSCADVSITPDGVSPGPIKAVGKPVDEPGARANDLEEVKENPEQVMDKASENLEEDITLAANEDSGTRKEEEVAAAQGDCILEDEPCDATVPCCDSKQFCVYTESSSGFTCRFWWSLWKDAQARDEL